MRELRNVADRFVLGLPSDGLNPAATHASGAMSLSEQTDRFERYLAGEALNKHAGQVAAVSDALDIPRKTLYDNLRKHGLSPDEFRQSSDEA